MYKALNQIITIKISNYVKANLEKSKKCRKIYFARKLPKIVDNLHDDHYHVDFGFLQ